MYATPPSKTHRGQDSEDSDAYWCRKHVSFQNDIKPSFNNDTPDSYTICSVWSTFSIAVEKCNGRCKLLHSWKNMLLKEHAAYRVQSALMIFPQVRSSIPAESYNMWENAIQPLMNQMNLSLPIVFLVWQFLQERLHFFKAIAQAHKQSKVPNSIYLYNFIHTIQQFIGQQQRLTIY